MLKPIAFANALAVLMAVFYALFAGLRAMAPEFFTYLFNAQFFGADIAVLVPERVSLGIAATLVITAWVSGYAFAWLYNRLGR